MLTAAIIAEYNPFHNGHAYHIQKTRDYGATHIVAIMSGNYTQRGTPAIADKRVRAAAALAGGADLVIELPLPYAMSTAQRFAYGAVGIAEALGCVDILSFGSESGYASIIDAASQAIDSPAVQNRVKDIMSDGVTYARARQEAVSEFYGDEIANMVANPNDSLGVEYLRQLRLYKSKITPHVVQRYATDHHQTTQVGSFASATLMRKLWYSDGLESISHLVPECCYEIYKQEHEKEKAPLDLEKFHAFMLPTLRKLSVEHLKKLPDISEGLENRIYAAIRQAVSIDEVYTLSKSKRYTAARIRRVVMSAFLGLEDELGAKTPPYIRVMGFNGRGREILAIAKATSTLPISDSLAYLSKIDKNCSEYANLEATSVDLYNLALPLVLPCGYDFTANSIRKL